MEFNAADTEPWPWRAPSRSRKGCLGGVASGLVAAWFGGTKEGNPDVGIWLSRQRDGQWTPVVEVANGAETESPRVNCLNPVLFQVPAGPLLLFYKIAWWRGQGRSSWEETLSRGSGAQGNATAWN